MPVVLVVDDDAEQCQLLARLIRAGGHSVHCACGGRDAMQTVSVLLPDLVVLDMAMPGMDGLQVLRAMREQPRLRDVPVIMFSATDLHRDEAMRAGAQEYLIKGGLGWGDLLVQVGRYTSHPRPSEPHEGAPALRE